MNLFDRFGRKYSLLPAALFLLSIFFLISGLLFAVEPPDSTQTDFLQYYRQFLEKQAHFGLWTDDILREIHQSKNQTLEFWQTVTPLKSNWLLENPGSVPFRDAAAEWVEAHSGGGYALPMWATSTGRGGARNPYGWQGRRVRHLDFVPSDLELDVLRALWDEPMQTDLELYRALTPHWRITAEQLQKMLAKMADEGLVARKQISPQNLFAVLLPFGVFYIEESSLNRKNRVFMYRPTVRRKQVISVLMQKLQATGKRKGENQSLREKLKSLLEIE